MQGSMGRAWGIGKWFFQNTNRQKSRCSQRGASLIEVLVAMLVLAIGLLGSTGAQLASLRLSEGARQLSEATLLLQDMVERMHANPHGVVSGAYVNSGAAVDAAELENTNACLAPSGCAPEAMADRDLLVWQLSLAQRLPGGVGQVCTAATSGGQLPGEEASGEAAECSTGISSTHYLLTINWDGNGDGLAERHLQAVFVP